MKFFLYQYHFVIFHFLIIHFILSDEEEIPNFGGEKKPLSNRLGTYSVEKLRDLLVNIDTDKDTLITENELIEWMVKLSLKDLEKQAVSAINFHDVNKDGKITWFEMLGTSYGYDEAAVARILESKDPVDRENYEFIIEDKAKFQLADVDYDGYLTVVEYKSLLNPSDHAGLMNLSINKIMMAHDKNNDSHLDENEFKLYFYVSNELTETQQEEYDSIFRRYDFNKDRKLSIEEMEKWYGPDIKLAAAIEADNLISKTDTNNDHVLTFNEVLSKASDWQQSHATSYGDHIKDEL